MTENEEKIKKLQENVESVIREREAIKEAHDKLYKDYITATRNLQDEKRLNERYLKIIENLTEE